MTDAPPPRVSVIVACYNAAPFLARCLHSVLAQTMAALEVIVVDDGSRDDGPVIARAIAADDARVVVLPPHANGGPAAARNRGLAVARGAWVAVMDSDDLWHPRRLELMLAEAEASAADIVVDDLLVFEDGSGAAPDRFLLPRDRGARFDIMLADYLARTIFYGAEPNLGFLKPLIRRDRLEAAGLRYDESLRIAEDDDFVARMLLAGLRYRVLALPLYFYRKHGASISHRLTVPALDAMIAAAEGFANRSAGMPALAGAHRRRLQALTRARAFEVAVGALKARRPLAAAAELARAPGAALLFRIPLRDRLRRGRKTSTPISAAPEGEAAWLTAAADAMLPPQARSGSSG